MRHWRVYINYQRQDPDANASKVAEHHHGSVTSKELKQLIQMHNFFSLKLKQRCKNAKEIEIIEYDQASNFFSRKMSHMQDERNGFEGKKIAPAVRET